MLAIASKELTDLPSQVVNRIIPAIIKLGENPHPAGCKKLKGEQNTWRIRVGDYRVVCTIDDVVRIVDAAQGIVKMFTINREMPPCASPFKIDALR